jgi:membrane peptidoglycan carboxypeptidase
VGRAVVGAPVVPGGPAGPGGPGRPNGPAPAGAGGRAPRGPRPPRSKRARRRNWIVASIAVMIMVAGGTLVGGTYVFAKVETPEALPAGQSTKIYYSDGKTQMAQIGDENRTIVPLDKIPVYLQHAVIAAEDRTYYDNDGVDFAGIVRAAWNNVRGGETQGASTITQQYARKIAELTTEVSYRRKAEEIAIAMKLADKYSKDEILGFYLNTVPFGRGAYGVEAAAQAYFGRATAMELTVEEAIMLAGFIKNPNGGGGTSTFDPNVNPDEAKARWEGTRNALVDIKSKLAKHGSDSYQVNTDMKMPVPPKYDRTKQTFQSQFGLDRPTGHIVHNVMDELSKLQKTDKNISQIKDLKNSGLRIITTIDPATQNAAETYADIANQKSPLHGYPQNLQAALVAVEPYTGRVIAYYGGPKGEGVDYAGSPADPVLDDGKMKMFGFHPAASSFKIYTLGAGLTEDISINSYWNGKSPRTFPGRGTAVKNANAEGGCEACPLWDMTVKSLNIPFYALTLELKNQAASVLEFARAAGIRYMRDDNGVVQDLNSAKATELATTGRNTNTVFNTEIGFGQYGITVLDHANGVASLAAAGNAAKVHFIREAWKDDQRVYNETAKLVPIPGYNAKMAADEAWTLQKVADNYGWNPPGRKVAAKTGTWENAKTKGANAHSWTVGYTAPARGDKNPAKNWNGLAVAVWVGNKAEELPIKLKDGRTNMQGSTGAGRIFGAFMKAATQGKPVGKFPGPANVGDENAGDASSPPPNPDPGQSGQPGQGGPGNSTGPGGGGGGGNNGRPTRPGRD